MERVMMLVLRTAGCSAEVLLNGMPVAYVGAGGGEVCVPVHEYTLAGRNRMDLVACAPTPGQAPVVASAAAAAPMAAVARLVLVRQGRSATDPGTRVLGELQWAAAEGTMFERPVTQTTTLELPVAFPRWRWFDAPPVTVNAGVQRQILAFVQQTALELMRGHPDGLLAASKLRFDELAIAYQSTPEQGVARFREHLQRLYAAKALKIIPPATEDLVLRPVAEGRLIDCLGPTGAPVLRTQNADPSMPEQAWPVRLAMVEGRIYVLR